MIGCLDGSHFIDLGGLGGTKGVALTKTSDQIITKRGAELALAPPAGIEPATSGVL